MHKNDLVVSIKSLKSGKFYRESHGKVFIPFGEEYALYVKNLSKQKAVYTFTIDGEQKLKKELVVNAGCTSEIIGDDLNKAFKFIQKTDKIEQHRGNKPQDGLLRVEFRFEIPFKSKNLNDWKWNEYHYHYHDKLRLGGLLRDFDDVQWGQSGNVFSSFNAGNDSGYASNNIIGAKLGGGIQCNLSQVNQAGPEATWSYTASGPAVQHDGMTVKGSEQNQSFQTVYVGDLGETHSITLQLTGLTENTTQFVKVGQYSRTKWKCDVCGTSNPANNKYCGECGNNLS